MKTVPTGLILQDSISVSSHTLGGGNIPTLPSEKKSILCMKHLKHPTAVVHFTAESKREFSLHLTK